MGLVTIVKNILRIEPGVSLAQWAYDRIANNWDRLATAFIAGGGMTYLGSITDWVMAWGPLGVGAVGLVSALSTWLIMSWASELRAKGRLRHAEADAVEQWHTKTDSFNPMDREFHTKRLKVSELVHPVSRLISDKRLIDCELIGPAVIAISGGRLTNVKFFRCEVMVIKNNGPLHNVVVLDKVTMIGGEIWNCTLLVLQRDVKDYVAMGAEFSTLTGLTEIDTQSPPSTQEKKQPSPGQHVARDARVHDD